MLRIIPVSGILYPVFKSIISFSFVCLEEDEEDNRSCGPGCPGGTDGPGSPGGPQIQVPGYILTCPENI